MNPSASNTNGANIGNVAMGLLGMWLLGTTGISLLLYFDPHTFIWMDQMDENTKGLFVVRFFLIQLLTQIPSICFAAFMFGKAQLANPMRTSFLAVLCLHSLLFSLRTLNWPWSFFPDLNQNIPFLMELVNVFLIAGSTAAITSAPSKLSARHLSTEMVPKIGT